MAEDVQCPYCQKWQEINHDDGYGYEEDEAHEQQCGDCDKNFIYHTSIHFYYEAIQADCLNGAEHQYKPTTTYPKEYTEMRCVDCEQRRPCTEEELKKVLAN